ncbi:MAG: hypothetical protein L0154_00705 [Chloroflexi bacterium]|nr:hypothetical protein [Chloroflexota bacterium]
MRNWERDETASGFRKMQASSVADGLGLPDDGQIMSNNSPADPSMEASLPVIKATIQPMPAF